MPVDPVRLVRGKSPIVELSSIIPKKYKKDIVFYDKSPNACKKKLKYGVIGTKDRVCDPTKDRDGRGDSGSCDHLCRSCKREVISKVETYEEDCDCVFEWCCSIKCQKCTRTRTITYCK